jgi:uncharacterized protein YukE
MVDIIRMDYAAMEALITAFKNANSALNDVMKAETGLASRVEEGALIGTAGSALQAAISGPLVKSTNKLAEKMIEEANDCSKAMSIMKEHDQEASGKFK